jgi:hypothetical protein
MSATIASSASANVIQFPAADRPSFSAATKAWLKRTHTHPFLTDANKTFATALYFYFNYKIYNSTGELRAWPTWDRLMGEFGLSKSTIQESTERLERYQLLEVDHGRYSRATKRRARNLYRVPARFGAHDQGTNFEPNQGMNFEQYSDDSLGTHGDSIHGDSQNLGDEIDSEREESLPPRAQGGQKPGRKLTEEELKASLERLERLAAAKRGRP